MIEIIKNQIPQGEDAIPMFVVIAFAAWIQFKLRKVLDTEESIKQLLARKKMNFFQRLKYDLIG